MKERFRKAQEAKRQIFERQGDLILIREDVAAVAFGISRQKLQELAGQSKSLVISPLGEGKVSIGLVESVAGRQRDLWEEMLESFNRGRSEANLSKRAYVKLATKLQRDLSRDWEEDSDLLQLALSTLWEQLPMGIQRTLDCISPDKVRSNIGVAGSQG